LRRRKNNKFVVAFIFRFIHRHRLQPTLFFSPQARKRNTKDMRLVLQSDEHQPFPLGLSHQPLHPLSDAAARLSMYLTGLLDEIGATTTTTTTTAEEEHEMIVIPLPFESHILKTVCAFLTHYADSEQHPPPPPPQFSKPLTIPWTECATPFEQCLLTGIDGRNTNNDGREILKLLSASDILGIPLLRTTLESFVASEIIRQPTIDSLQDFFGIDAASEPPISTAEIRVLGETWRTATAMAFRRLHDT
jgi:hypothetical protein